MLVLLGSRDARCLLHLVNIYHQEHVPRLCTRLFTIYRTINNGKKFTGLGTRLGRAPDTLLL